MGTPIERDQYEEEGATRELGEKQKFSESKGRKHSRLINLVQTYGRSSEMRMQNWLLDLVIRAHV